MNTTIMHVWFPGSFFCVFVTILHFATLANGQAIGPWMYETNLTLTPYVNQNGSQIIQCSKATPANVKVWMSNQTCSSAPSGNFSSFWTLTKNTTDPVIDYRSSNYRLSSSNLNVSLTVKIVTFLESNDKGAPTNCVCCVDIESSNSTETTCKDVSIGNPPSNNNDNGSNNVDRLTFSQLALVLIAFVHSLWS